MVDVTDADTFVMNQRGGLRYARDLRQHLGTREHGDQEGFAGRRTEGARPPATLVLLTQVPDGGPQDGQGFDLRRLHYMPRLDDTEMMNEGKCNANGA
jgi:hypothetical protein